MCRGQPRAASCPAAPRNPGRQRRVTESLIATIIAGNFAHQTQADDVVQVLLRGGVARPDVCELTLNTPGQYGVRPTGAVADQDPTHPSADEPTPPRRAGVLVAVHAPTEAAQRFATDVMLERGARDMERAEGTWRDGQWVDFDPNAPPARITAPR